MVSRKTLRGSVCWAQARQAAQRAGLFGGPIGVWGDSGPTGGTGVLGTADDGIAGRFYNNSSSGYPALSVGNVYQFPASLGTTVFEAVGNRGGTVGACNIDTSGNLGCTGSKSAVVPVDNGSRKAALYAVQATENFFEDAGSGRLSNGSALVGLDPTFAQTVNTGLEYHVFLTPNADCKGLYVSQKSADSFEVRELGGGTSNIAFDYRIMAN